MDDLKSTEARALQELNANIISDNKKLKDAHKAAGKKGLPKGYEH